MQLNTWVWHSCELQIEDEFQNQFGAELQSYFSGKINDSRECTTHPPIQMAFGDRKTKGNYQELNHYDDHSITHTKICRRVCMLVDDALSVEYNPDMWLSIILPKKSLQNKFIWEYILRTVRTYIDKILVDAGFAFFHLWAVRAPNKTIVISGGKGAGKTTSVITALEKFWAQYIANDRVWWKWSENGLQITEREGDTKIWAATVQNSPILSQISTEKDDKTGKFHYPQVYRLFWNWERSISWVAQYIFCPHVLEASAVPVKKIPHPDDVLFDSFEELGIWFNQYRALFGGIQKPHQKPNFPIIKEWLEWFGPKGILDAFEILFNT